MTKCPPPPRAPYKSPLADARKLVCRLVLQVVTAPSLVVVELAVAEVAESSRSAVLGMVL